MKKEDMKGIKNIGLKKVVWVKAYHGKINRGYEF